MNIFTLLAVLFLLFSCSEKKELKTNVVQSEDYVLVEFAAKLEEQEHKTAE